MNISDLETPALLIEHSALERNLATMQNLANTHGVKLRPHTKSHKMPWLAHKQLQLGASGITVAKLAEAETMAHAGIRDIHIANHIVGTRKLTRLTQLAQKVDRLSCAIDSVTAARALSQAFRSFATPFEVLIEIDTGLRRCGIAEYREIHELCAFIRSAPGLTLGGIMTHAGHAYGARDRDEALSIGRQEGSDMARLADKLRKDGIPIATVSVGSTPTAASVVAVPGVTELRAGNYVFHDMIQVGLGSSNIEECSLSVLATVVSVPTAERAVVDAGSKALTQERGAHNSAGIEGFGYIPAGKTVIARLSEEHGVIEQHSKRYAIGDRVRIIPNHACTVVNMFDMAYLVDGDKVIRELAISARGKMT